jgi:hypothetical protein
LTVRNRRILFMSQKFPSQQNVAPPRQGMSKGAKGVIISCLAIAVLGAIILVVVGTLGYWGVRKTADSIAKVKSDYDRRMGIDPELAALTNALDTELIQWYKNDVVAADAAHKGKRLVISGLIEEVEKSGQVYILLKSSGKKEDVGVQCFFTDEQKSAIANVKVGQFATILGVCDGKKQNIELQQCELKGCHDV